MTEVCENCKPLFEKLLRRIEDLERKNTELERRLAAYENAHTPYSRRIFKPRPKPSNSKLGRPKGYQGSTRPVPKPDRQVEKKFSKCPNCNGRLKHMHKESTIVEEIPKPQCTLMKFEDRLTFRKVHDAMKRHYELEITPASILNMTRSVSNRLSKEHEELIRKIRLSACVYADETSIA